MQKTKYPVFVTGNAKKVTYISSWLGIELAHHAIDLNEIQSMDLREVAEHKARKAYEILQKPVLVEDAGLSIHSLGELPGPLVKWFLERMTLQEICSLLPGDEKRSARASVCYCYFDGQDVHFFEGYVDGVITEVPRVQNGMGFDPIFQPNTANKTFSEMNADEIEIHSVRVSKIFPELRKFLTRLE